MSSIKKHLQEGALKMARVQSDSPFQSTEGTTVSGSTRLSCPRSRQRSGIRLGERLFICWVKLYTKCFVFVNHYSVGYPVPPVWPDELKSAIIPVKQRGTVMDLIKFILFHSFWSFLLILSGIVDIGLGVVSSATGVLAITNSSWSTPAVCYTVGSVYLAAGITIAVIQKRKHKN